jgi:sigma-B regulation protein RsbU (phosphoserine phosphatase)
MSFSLEPEFADSALPLAEQVVRLQALLEASRAVHSTFHLNDVLEQSARIAVRELEMDGAMFTEPHVVSGEMPESLHDLPRFELLARDGTLLTQFVIATPAGRDLTLYERDFLEGLVLQTAVAVENAINHERHLAYARVARDLDAARAIQRSLLPQSMPVVAGYSLASRSQPCYEVGGDYLDVFTEPDGSLLIIVADVAGKGLASALMGATIRSAFRALARQSLSLDELATTLSQQHWEEGIEARRRYVTAIFIRLNASTGTLECVNAGHNPAVLLSRHASEPRLLCASGTPLGMLPGTRYEVESLHLEPDAALLLYTDGLTEIFQGEEEFGQDRLVEAFHSADDPQRSADPARADAVLNQLWTSLDAFSSGGPQQDDMSAVALCRLVSTPTEI